MTSHADDQPELTKAMIVTAVEVGHYPVLIVGDLELRLDDNRLIMVSLEEGNEVDAVLVYGAKGQSFESIHQMTISSNDEAWLVNFLQRGDRNDFS